MDCDPDAEAKHTDSTVQLRPFPYPYRAMLAICSDLDSTANQNVYWEIMRFLNTGETTAMGPGVGLEVGNSIHFRANPPQFSYWDTDDAGRDMVRSLIHSGHIDCLHSFGERIYTRDEAKRALAELEEHDCRLEIWVDHGSAITNFGPDIMDGHGDEVDHPAYHADLTMDYGIQYVCRGRGTSVVGQGIPARLGGIFTMRHPLASARTLGKEAAKQVLARSGNRKYSMHATNDVLRPCVLRDGHRVYEFIRCNPHWGGVSSCDQGRYVGEVLTAEMLDRLVARGGACILYTHLGKVDNPAIPFNDKAVAAFRHLAEEHHAGKILVTTTRRLLGYCRALQEVAWEVRDDGTLTRIDIRTESSRNWTGRVPAGDLAGLTFYVCDARQTHVTIDGRRAADLTFNPPDHTDRPSVSLPWASLTFSAL